ncbi:MAG: YicC/YloC family endoribonuclease [Pseudomonadota bacterium]|nr:YicC/YloC family endoribonuclease [Pseudomonadota bacterium]
MTAFASAETQTDAGRISCEMRAVNHRFLDISLRLPEELRVLEPVIREKIAARLSRGKLDVTIRLAKSSDGDALQLDPAFLDRLSYIAMTLSSKLPGLHTDLTAILQMPGVLQACDIDTEKLHADALALLATTLDAFVAAREREGAKLAAVIAERVEAVAAIATQVRGLVPLIRQAQRAKLTARMAEFADTLEPGRLEQELVLWLQKLDVDEELDRLDSHVAELHRVLKQREPVGRRLDFLLQEFNREANTLGSKSVDARTSNAVIELKVLIDQIREQVQNLE